MSEAQGLSGVSAVSCTVNSKHKGTPNPRGFWGQRYAHDPEFSWPTLAQIEINQLSEHNPQP